MINSEWGTANMFEDGANPELLLAGKYGHQLHVWDLQRRCHRQTIDLGEQQMVLELRPAHDPSKAYGFAGVVTSLLAFDSNSAGQMNVFVVSAESGTVRRLTYESYTQWLPRRSRDGEWIYFQARRQIWQIWKVKSTGGQPVQLTRDGGEKPVESADGKFVY